MKSIVSCCVDSEMLKEAKLRKISPSQILQKGLEIEVALTNGLRKQRVEELIEGHKKEIQLLELRVQELKEREKKIELIKNLPDVQEAIKIVKENPLYFDGRLKLLNNSGIEIARDDFKKLVFGEGKS